MSFVCGKVFENRPKTKEKCNFTKPTSMRVISTGNHLFGPKIRYQKSFDKKMGEFSFEQSVRKLPEN